MIDPRWCRPRWCRPEAKTLNLYTFLWREQAGPMRSSTQAREVLWICALIICMRFPSSRTPRPQQAARFAAGARAWTRPRECRPPARVRRGGRRWGGEGRSAASCAAAAVVGGAPTAAQTAIPFSRAACLAMAAGLQDGATAAVHDAVAAGSGAVGRSPGQTKAPGADLHLCWAEVGLCFHAHPPRALQARACGGAGIQCGSH